MTPDKTPTDSEILDAAEDFRSQYKHGGTTFDDFDALAFARAVLAKWGSPVAAVEPVAWLVRADGEDHHAVVSSKRESADLWIKGQQTMGATYVFTVHPLVTPSQPTQAQAGAVPLTPEQIKDEASHHGFIGSTEMLVKFVRGIEAAHGIKEGGQHVAN